MLPKSTEARIGSENSGSGSALSARGVDGRGLSAGCVAISDGEGGDHTSMGSEPERCRMGIVAGSRWSRSAESDTEVGSDGAANGSESKAGWNQRRSLLKEELSVLLTWSLSWLLRPLSVHRFVNLPDFPSESGFFGDDRDLWCDLVRRSFWDALGMREKNESPTIGTISKDMTVENGRAQGRMIQRACMSQRCGRPGGTKWVWTSR